MAHLMLTLHPSADEEAGAEEHDEITGGAEAQELAKKAAEAGADEVEDDGPLEDDGSYEPIGE